jgi:hypothetical protein
MFGHTSLKTVVAGLAVAAVVMGCEVEDDDLMGPAQQPQQPAPVNQPVSVISMQGPLEVTLIADRANYQRHETVYLQIRVRNTGHSAVTFNFTTGQQHDFFAETHGGAVWRYSNGQHYSRVAHHVTVQPGETWVREGTWDQRDNTGWEVPRGVYGMRGVVTHYSGNASPVFSEMLPITLR